MFDYSSYVGEAMAMGERSPIAVLDAPASGRMAIGEALTNLAAAPVARLADIKMSANWMAACGTPGQDAALYDTVAAIGMELCPALGIGIPGRQGLVVDAHCLAGRRTESRCSGAGVARGVGFRRA